VFLLTAVIVHKPIKMSQNGCDDAQKHVPIFKKNWDKNRDLHFEGKSEMNRRKCYKEFNGYDGREINIVKREIE
jgi:hypothetical protein